MTCISPIAPFGDTRACVAGALRCMTARIQCAGHPEALRGLGNIRRPWLYAAVKPFDVVFPADATNEHDTQPSTMVVMRQTDVPNTRETCRREPFLPSAKRWGFRLKGRPRPTLRPKGIDLTLNTGRRAARRSNREMAVFRRKIWQGYRRLEGAEWNRTADDRGSR